MTNISGKFADTFCSASARSAAERWLPVILWLGIFLALFCGLGAPGLFEPDEGRNAEKAREILVLSDWVTPHENFHPVLDKPIFFYWLVALAYRILGVSEWAARVPSAIASLGCIAFVYRFADVRWGRWTALWSALILLTCAEFFVLSRVVILDMALTFCVTTALCAFYEATHNDSLTKRRAWCAVMYMGLAAATLVKGLVGVVVPGLVIFFYLLLTKQWQLVRRVDLLPGALFFFLLVLPWYFLAEARNEGFLKYYFWEEHFGRFVTDEFDRGEPWYYFVFVCAVGFLPWTPLLPVVVKATYKAIATERPDDKTVYLLLWILLPFLFFSVSESKLPHYILPLFPPLAMLTAAALVRMYHEAPSRLQFALSLTWWVQFILGLFFLMGWFQPALLPRQIRSGIIGMPHVVWIYAAVSASVLASLARQALPRSQGHLYIVQGSALSVLLALIVQMMVSVSAERSAKPIAQAVSVRLGSDTRLAQYDTYLAGLPFYLESKRPLWLITRERKKRSFLGNYYEIGKRENPVTPWGQVIFNFEEFHERYHATKQPLLIIVKEKNLPRLARQLEDMPIRLAASGEYLLVAKAAPTGSHVAASRFFTRGDE